MPDETDTADGRVHETLGAIFRTVLQLPPDVDVGGLRQSDSEAWDSLGHVSIITAVESEFEIDVGVSDAMELTSFQAVVEYVKGALTDGGEIR